MDRTPAMATVVVSALSVAGCNAAPADESGAAEQPTVATRDSAGIEIVENHAPLYAPDEFWTFDTVPEFVLGGANTLGEPAHDSAQLIWDVVGLARLEDGRVAVLSQRGKHLLLFEPSGNLSRIIGRSGEGPGEFTLPEWLQYLPPDTLVVWDYFMTSIDHFDTTGVLVGERRGDHARLLELGIYGENFGFPIADGAFMAVMVGREVDPERPWSDCSPREFWTFRADPESLQPISQGELSEWVPEEYVVIDSTFSAHSLGCPSQVAFGGHPPSIYIPARRRNEIYRFDLDGSLSRIIRRSTEVEPIVLNWGGSPEGAGAVVADTLPPFFDVVVDTEGYLWARSSSPETGLGDHWSIFSPEGRWLGVMAVPWGRGLCRRQGYTSSCWVDRDFFMILRRDELGVERVEGYRIRRDG
ncbi:MAG: hypothetical protein F4187_08120 [Gemmatimonadetes bacterium]|nr:hypothetical protein [Gemmatimonadota bacterium]MYI06771.1 hypothetical protein [Gemmatimonadota bacterium]